MQLELGGREGGGAGQEDPATVSPQKVAVRNSRASGKPPPAKVPHTHLPKRSRVPFPVCPAKGLQVLVTPVIRGVGRDQGGASEWGTNPQDALGTQEPSMPSPPLSLLLLLLALLDLKPAGAALIRYGCGAGLVTS